MALPGASLCYLIYPFATLHSLFTAVEWIIIDVSTFADSADYPGEFNVCKINKIGLARITQALHYLAQQLVAKR